MANYIANAFSLMMVKTIMAEHPCMICTEEVPVDNIPSDVISCVGHADTAAVLSDLLGIAVPMDRKNITLQEGDVLYVAQLQGGRLPEGCTRLPEGYSFIFYKVQAVTHPCYRCGGGGNCLDCAMLSLFKS